MSEIKIHKNVQLPQAFQSLPFDKLGIGDAFYVDGVTNTSNLSSKRQKAELQLNRKFRTQKATNPDTKAPAIMVIRVA